jgi:NADH-quinone oxidoreductase subunit K
MFWFLTSLSFSLILFFIGIFGLFINRRNVITLLMCIELMLLAANTSFVSFSYINDDLRGQLFVFFILAVAAVEAAIGLSILVKLFRDYRSINVESLNRLKG